MKLYVDDVRMCPRGWLLARDTETAISLLGEGIVTELSLDHDMGADCGMNVVDFLVEHYHAMLPLHTVSYHLVPTIQIHSLNAPAAKQMQLALQRIGYKDVPIIPNFPWQGSG